ncbi:MAG: MotA/TolQ/ExbB proton channel family protein [Chitinophagaceae bacterium]|nr:MotA/TolQ/ExbB proton channel family protein [Chitinophagaceae bacterium]NBY25630.1 MotA/TolQ/ExbB proton channel family protein [Chitinophagaceae bacterium]NDB52944.1 MotA/TolQ/ExbB proton channel family protein [Chitinophagaceae bacterium]HAL94959.1 biopolymer transporter ExbB [Chitinophagaceae bacterium]
MIHFLQITESSPAKATAVAGDINKDGFLSLWELLSTGGWIMIPLGIMFLLAVYVFIERYMAIKAAGRVDDNFMNIIKDHLLTGNIAAAKSFTKNTNNPVARIIDKGIQRIGKPLDRIEASMDNVGVLEMYKLEKNLAVLSVISKAAPIFGFVGTLVGLMQLFSAINTTNEFEVATIAGGIYTKLVTSISGLAIGLLAYLGYSYLNTQIDKASHQMEAASADFLDILQEPTQQQVS